MRRINQLMTGLNPKLTDIYQRALFIEDLNSKVLHYLPEQLQTHFSVGSFSNGYLVLMTTDPVWASQLRYHLPDLRDRLRKDAGLYQLASIKINVSTQDMLQIVPSRATYLPISTKARGVILAGSEQCGYTPLKMALKQLATPVTQRF